MYFKLVLFALCWLGNLGQSSAGDSIKPLSIPPSMYWDGDDGQWSTFAIQVGTPGQTVRLLPGTSASAGTTIWVVISEGCVNINPNMAHCLDKRGGLFHSNISTTWSTQGLQTSVKGAIYSLGTVEESLLGRDGNGSYGYDTVSLGIPGSGLPTLKKQIIAGIWTNNFSLGSLGISPIPVNFTTLNDAPEQPNLLGTLRNQSLIPSASWAYTAGAHYKNPPVFGSLTLGGYDTTRFKTNDLDFTFGADISRDLLVSLQSITYDTAGSSPLLASSIDMFIDSLVSEIWLPVNVCEAFAQQFNLTWNEEGQLYFIQEKAHTALLAQNPTFTFTIGQAGGGGQTVDIVLPYSAFDLNLTAPIVGNTTRYFPLKHAQDSSQYTLGRTFLQEAYVIADYERHNFSVAQALFPPTSVPQNIVPIVAPIQEANGNGTIHAPTQASQGKGNRPSKGVIAGIVVAALAVLVIGTLVVVFWLKPKPEPSTKVEVASLTSTDDGPVGIVPEVPGEENAVHELEVDAAELRAHEGPHGRHELSSVAGLHETDGRQLTATEIEALRSQPRRQ